MSLLVTGRIAPSLNVTWLVPALAIVITSEPEKVIEVFVSPSSAILSNWTAPTLLSAASPKSNAPATVKVPEISTSPLISMVVAVNLFQLEQL